MPNQTIVAIEQDGLTTRTLTMSFDILSDRPGFDLVSAVKAAVRDYLHTPEGRATYEYNCHNFNWADFSAHVPNSLCIRHGFQKSVHNHSDTVVDLDEHLADDYDYQEFWET